MKNTLVSQRALVTGGAAGIGRATAFALARIGMKVAVVDLDAGAAARVCEQLIANGHEALAIGAAVHDSTQVERTFKTIDEAWGGIDVLVNNVGISVVNPTLELTPQEWQHTLDVNLGSLFHCSQAAGRRMVAQLSGSIVNIGSIYSLMAAPNRLTYCTTKAAVAMATKCLAVEWASSGVRVNAVAPGYVETAFTAELVRTGKFDPAAILKRTPMGRFGTAEEVAEAVSFLVSKEAAYVTGQILGIDGGWTAYGYV